MGSKREVGAIIYHLYSFKDSFPSSLRPITLPTPVDVDFPLIFVTSLQGYLRETAKLLFTEYWTVWGLITHTSGSFGFLTCLWAVGSWRWSTLKKQCWRQFYKCILLLAQETLDRGRVLFSAGLPVRTKGNPRKLKSMMRIKFSEHFLCSRSPFSGCFLSLCSPMSAQLQPQRKLCSGQQCLLSSPAYGVCIC